MSSIKRLTPEILKKMIDDEKRQLSLSETTKSSEKTKVVDAQDLADTLAKKIDYAKKLGLQEARLINRLKEITRKKVALKKLILKEL